MSLWKTKQPILKSKLPEIGKRKIEKKATVDSYRRTAKLYIKDYATKEDMQEFNKIFEDNQ